MTAVRLDKLQDDFKTIDTRTQDLIDGYIKIIQQSLPTDNVYYIIPALVIRWILLYFYIRDQFDRNHCADCYTISDDNYIITKSPTDTTGCVYCSQIRRHGIHRWRFKLRNVTANQTFIVIGIWKVNHEMNVNSDLWQWSAQGKAYGWIVNYKRKINGDKSEWYSYGKKECVTGDVIEMILDLNKMKLSYFCNGEDYGRAYKSLEKTGYKAVVHCGQGESVELLSG